MSHPSVVLSSWSVRLCVCLLAAFGPAACLGETKLVSPPRVAPTSVTLEFRADSEDLATATARVEFERDGVRFERTHFVSAPDQVFVSRLTASRRGALSFEISLDRPERFVTTAAGPDELLMTGTLNDGRGGKGVASYLGFVIPIAPWGAAAACLAWVAVHRIVRIPFIASFCMILVLGRGVAAACDWEALPITGTAATVLLIFFNHKRNIAEGLKKFLTKQRA